MKYSQGKWGFIVQAQIWQDCGGPPHSNESWKKFGEYVGWRKENSWMSYTDLTFDLRKSRKGEFPAYYTTFDYKLLDLCVVVFSLEQRIAKYSIKNF